MIDMRRHAIIPKAEPGEPGPCQEWNEWQLFLDLTSTYFKVCLIDHPVILEIGCHRDKQRPFYEAIGGEYLGIDISDIYAMPDILGDCHDPAVIDKVKAWLAGRPINLLFIDGSHLYEDVRRDYEIYSPMVRGIIAFHDIAGELGVNRFWDELQAGIHGNLRKLFLNLIFSTADIRRVGTGVVIDP